jgi:hypothetical protein
MKPLLHYVYILYKIAGHLEKGGYNMFDKCISNDENHRYVASIVYTYMILLDNNNMEFRHPHGVREGGKVMFEMQQFHDELDIL